MLRRRPERPDAHTPPRDCRQRARAAAAGGLPGAPRTHGADAAATGTTNDRATVNVTGGEPTNGHAHCRALLLPASACLNVVDGRLAARRLAARLPGGAGWPARPRGVGRRRRGGRAMKVKMILPALTEATSPFFRPIKYSLFPPLGLATLAGYLDDDDEVEIQDEHVEALDLDDAPDLVVIQVYITSAQRAYRLADHYRRRGALRGAGRPARDVAARGSGAPRRHHLPRARRGHVAAVPRRLQARAARARVSIRRSARWPACRRSGAI